MTEKTITWKTIDGIKWCYDERNNRCSVRKYGTEERAQKALESLKNCSDCSDCSNCSDCSYCSYCSDCSDCSNCSDCSDCSYCSYCSYCSNCSDCSDCSYCSYCSYCSNCSDCSNRYRYHDKKDSELDLFTIPKIENIHQKVYAAASQENGLEMGAWHTCETTHCRAGWVNFLAGEEGKKLEARFGSALAGSMIYRKSSDIKVGMNEFFKGNTEALESMRKAAEEEANQPKQ